MPDAQVRQEVELLLERIAADTGTSTYRVALRHPDKDHPTNAWFQWRQPWDSRAHADAAAGLAKDEFPDHDVKVQELVVKDTDGDGNPETHSWKDVK
jgi:hypothetical protein